MQNYEPLPDVVLSDGGVNTCDIHDSNPPTFDSCITTALCTCEYFCYITAALFSLCGMCR